MPSQTIPNHHRNRSRDRSEPDRFSLNVILNEPEKQRQILSLGVASCCNAAF